MSRRKGLVLEGGGAKGAYAFGWLMEFASRGVKFDAVAGTSVGALNALLWASDQIGAGEQLWRSISEETTLAIRRPRWLWSILVLPYAVHRLLAERISNLEDHIDLSYIAFFVAAITAVPAAWLATEIVREAIIWGATLVAPPTGLGQFARQALWFVQWWLVVCSGIVAMLMMMAPTWADGLVRFSWRSSTPLREGVEAVLRGKAIGVPTYVAVAEYREVCDPDRLRFWRGRTAPQGLWVGYDRYVPIYVPLHKEPKDRLAHFVLASASLPYGVTLPVSVGDRLLVDGGVIDNSPVLPLVSHEHCDFIVVIKLRRVPAQTRTQYAETFRRLQRLQLAAALTPTEASRMRTIGATLNVDEPAVWPELVTVMPSCHLGSLLSSHPEGTGATKSSAITEFRAMLRFAPDFVDRLIALGRADAAAQPAEFWRRLSA